MSLLRSSSVHYVETGKKTKSKRGNSRTDALRQVNRSRGQTVAERNADFRKEMEKLSDKVKVRKGLSDRKVDRKGWTESQVKRYIKARDINRDAIEHKTFDNVLRALGRKPKYPTYYETQAPARKRAAEKAKKVFAAKTFVDTMRAVREDINAATVAGVGDKAANNRYPNEQQMKQFFKNKVADKLRFAELDERRLLIEQGLLKELALWLTWSTMWNFEGGSSTSKYLPSEAEAALGRKGQRLIRRWIAKSWSLAKSFDGPLGYELDPNSYQRYSGYDLELVNMIVKCLVGGTIQEYQVNADQYGNRKKTVKRMSHFPWYKDTGQRTIRGQVILGWDIEKMTGWMSAKEARHLINFKLDPASYNVKDNEIQTREGGSKYARTSRFDIFGKYGGEKLYQEIRTIILIAQDDNEEILYRMFPDGKPQEYGRASLLRKRGSSAKPAFPEHDFKTRIWARLKLLASVWEQRSNAHEEFLAVKEELARGRKQRNASAQAGDSSSEEEFDSDVSSESSSSEDSDDFIDEDDE